MERPLPDRAPASPAGPRPPRPRHVRTGALAALVTTAAALLLGGCGAEEPAGRAGTAEGRPGAPPKARPADVPELASAVGCEAEITIDVADYRQGTCDTGRAEYVFVSFESDTGKRAWLETAQMYGGVYLVGNRWVLSADPRPAMERARERLGGTIEETGALGAEPAP
ncbi:hypothetical protein [Streptomyces zingiberis]|uniref:Lipoprotein n=1 Tax=Streptomyces zingiberis TaxID=2053010 RepID=A0ABX1C4E7_9ACTN|nr:hypothetical protein [Streptomyces zingiberis]NJQ03478.1 hypothetical protein [Streptomyces zingiberis]